MITYLKSALAIYNTVKWIVSLLERRKWIDQGKAEAVREQLQDMMNEAEKAIAAANSVSDDVDSVRNDPNNRDRNQSG